MVVIPDSLRSQWAAYRNDPCGFVHRFWPHVVLADYQVEILRSVVDNVETWVQSANEVGKSFTAALTAIWWFATRPGIVVCVSPSQGQLERVLWQEILNLLATAELDGQPFDFGFSVNFLDIRHRNEAGSKQPKYYLVGQCVAKDQSLAGAHLATLPDDTPTILFIGEEVSHIDDKFWRVIRTSRHRLLAIGNPVRTDTEMYRVCRLGDQPHPTDKSRLWSKVIRVSAGQSPNVIVAEKLRALGRPLPKRPPVPGLLSYEEYINRRSTFSPWESRSSLDGLFNDEGGSLLFPAAHLDFAQALYGKLKTGEPNRSESLRRWLTWWGWPFGLGVDCATGGGDLSAWAVFGRFGAVYIETLDTFDTTMIETKTRQLMRRWRIQPQWVCFDRSFGKTTADYMRKRGLEVEDVQFGEAAIDKGKYPLMRDEMYGELAEAMGRPWTNDGTHRRGYEKLLSLDPSQWRTLLKVRPVCLPDDSDLRQELFVLPRTCEKGERGRLKLIPKEGDGKRLGVKQLLGGRSPDKADALVLARYGYERGQEYRRLSRPDGQLVW